MGSRSPGRSWVWPYSSGTSPYLPWACAVGAALLTGTVVYRLTRREYTFYASPGYYAEGDPILDSLTSSSRPS